MKTYSAKRIQFQISEEIGSTSGLYIRPVKPKFLLVLAHGAGAGMEHPFMETLAQLLAHQKVATLRFNFAYMENGKKVPDRPKKALPAISAAINQAKKIAKGVPVLIGGKSFGGRMCSQLAAIEKLTDIKGIIYFGFPLHAIGKPSIDRAAHLSDIPQPQLFLQGTRDSLAKIDLIKQVCKKLKKAKLEIIEGGDHSFKMLKSTGVTQEEMVEKLAIKAAAFYKG